MVGQEIDLWINHANEVQITCLVFGTIGFFGLLFVLGIYICNKIEEHYYGDY
jgi:hypothetical protein